MADEELQVTYHSRYGAISESLCVFINAGLNHFLQYHSIKDNPVRIFEMGFGTGLNALLALQFAIQKNQKVYYQTIEPIPLSKCEYEQLNYASLLDNDLQKSFQMLHECVWDKPVEAHPLFCFKKTKAMLQQFITSQKYDVVFFDAFDPNTQPELWTEDIFKKMFEMLSKNGVLVTYCSKGVVRRAMQAVGFKVEKLKGPKGKREIVRAVKL